MLLAVLTPTGLLLLALAGAALAVWKLRGQ